MDMNTKGKGMWGKFGLMMVLSFLVMYALMYLMVDRWASVYVNLNQLYMTGAMVAAMAVIELVVMAEMYKNASLRNVVIGTSVLLLVACIVFTRYQTGIGDTNFLRSMIPHHSGAILMCSESKITDPETKALCQSIIKSQSEEIEQMKAILARSQ